jgi:glycosyltransferase involved in cell wall biosynthesis
VKLSIITVCLNQVGTIEEALRSVLEQERLPAGGLEYIVVDGGSADGTADVIRQYAGRLAWWVSEPDHGQSHALNKGFARATGDVVGWLNADDRLLPGALALVAEAFERGDCDVLCGQCRYEFADGEPRILGVRPGHLHLLDVYDPIHQPSCFWRREWHEKVGGLREDLHYGMDWDLWLRLWRAGARFQTTDAVLSVYRMTGSNKTSVGGQHRNRELYDLLRQHGCDSAGRLLTELAYRALWPLKRLRRRSPSWLCRPVSDAARTAVLMALGPLLGFERVRCCTHPFS